MSEEARKAKETLQAAGYTVRLIPHTGAPYGRPRKPTACARCGEMCASSTAARAHCMRDMMTPGEARPRP